MLRCLWRSMLGLYAVVFRTANFRRDVRQEIRMTPVQSVQNFTSNSSYCFPVNFFLDWHMCQNSCSNLSDQVEAYCTVKRSSLLISLGPLPISACAQIRLTSKLFRYTKQFRWYSLERWHRLMWLWQGALLSLSLSYFITTEAWLPPLNSPYRRNKTKRHNSVNLILPILDGKQAKMAKGAYIWWRLNV